MERSLIPMMLPSGREVLMPADSAPTGDDADSSSRLVPGEFEDVSMHFEFKDVIDTVTEIGVMLRDAMKTIAPRKAMVELSVGIDVKTGRLTACFVDAGMSGGLRVTFEWGGAPAELA